MALGPINPELLRNVMRFFIRNTQEVLAGLVTSASARL